MAKHRFLGVIRRLFLPHMKIDATLELPDPSTATIPAVITSLWGAVEFESAENRVESTDPKADKETEAAKTLKANEIAIVTYRRIETPNPIPVQTAHYGPTQRIKANLGGQAGSGVDQWLFHSGYIVRLK